MKTLLEWLEENRSELKDGVYAYGTAGSVTYNGLTLSGQPVVNFTLDKYKLENGNITLIEETTLSGHCAKLAMEHETTLTGQWNKYNRECKGVTIDVYDVLKAFEVTDPALQHLIKKALCTGLRGHKSREQDLQDILGSAKRAVELNK